MPAANTQDEALRGAMANLNESGYIVVDDTGTLVGKLAKARLSSEERARARRETFKLVQGGEPGQ